jgi:N-dimethylarginine dimethylaminohydrolase
LLMIRAPDPCNQWSEALGLAKLYESLGVRVTWVTTPEALPNFIFQRDLYFATPWGVILGRPAPSARAGEERYAAAALAHLGVPIVGTMRGSATFEAADAMWLTPRLVTVGVGVRTNPEGFRIVQALLAEMGVAAVSVPMSEPGQHLLGTFVPLAEDLACVVRNWVPSSLRDLAVECGYSLISFEMNDEVGARRGLNFVCVAPRVIVMPSGAPKIYQTLSRFNIECHVATVDEFVAAAGGIACATGILSRDDPYSTVQPPEEE